MNIRVVFVSGTVCAAFLSLYEGVRVQSGVFLSR